MSLDAVIARSRIAGGFSEHRRFTIARSRAIEKMRRFALPNPHDYALEFVQAAVANGAWHVSLSLERDECMISYIGGGLREHELANLFDFLFASKDRSDIEHVRGLALGINAALLFAPKQVVIESGDGTLAGTSRMVLDPVHDQVDIGRADRPLMGTFVALRGMDRKALPHPVAWSGRAPETGQLETRCLAAPIPIVVNGEPLFGFSRQRTPALFGYAKVLAFDEGELYGTIGLTPTFDNHGFNLLTRGVSIQTRAYDLIPGQRIGGVVCFDRLRKTVDHAAIVDDERLHELWLRLRRYAEALVSGRATSGSSVRLIGARGDDRELGAVELCTMLREVPRVVVADPIALQQGDATRRVVAIGRALAAPVLAVTPEQHDWLSVLSGRRVRLVCPALDTDADTRFFVRPIARPPAEPWVTAPIDLVPESMADAVAAMGLAGDEAARAHAVLGRSPIAISVYAVDHPSVAWGMEVQLWIAEREAWRGVVAQAESGHVTIVRLEEARVAALLADTGPTSLLQRLVAHAVARGRAARLRLCARALANVAAIAPGTARARLVLQAVDRSVLVRLRSVAGRPSLRFVQFGDDAPALLDLPVLRDHTGGAVSLRRLEDLAAVVGVVLGAAPQAALDGIDPATVIEVDAEIDARLRAWLGPAGFVRLDAEVLLERPGSVCRGFNCTGARWWSVDGDRRAAAIDGRDALLAIVAGPRGAEAELLLQWAAIDTQSDPALADVFLDVPAFTTDDGVRVTLRAILQHRASGIRVTFAAPSLATTVAAQAEPDGPFILACSAPIARALAAIVPVHPCFDVELGLRKPPETLGLLAWIDLDDATVLGRLGIPRAGVTSLLVVDTEGEGGIEVHELASEFGAIGVVRLRDGADVEAVLDRLREALGALVDRLRDRVSSGALVGADRTIALRRLLHLATRSVRLSWRPDGTLVPRIDGPSAAAILQLPVLDTTHGGPVGIAWALVRFCQLVAAGESAPMLRIFGELGREPEPELAAWLQAWPIPARPPRPPMIERPPQPLPPRDALARTLADHLARLRPDTMLDAPATVLLEDHGRAGALLSGVMAQIVVNEAHPIVAQALERPGDPELLAWTLLAIYAEINAVLDAVENTHELVFQQRVVEALLAGELG